MRVRHTFGENVSVGPGCAVVIFGGGTPTGTFGNATVIIASSGRLEFNNNGDTVTLSNGDAVIAAYTYANEGGQNQSLTRFPDVTGNEPLLKHTDISQRRFSPGTRTDGTDFADCGAVLPTATATADSEPLTATPTPTPTATDQTPTCHIYPNRARAACDQRDHV